MATKPKNKAAKSETSADRWVFLGEGVDQTGSIIILTEDPTSNIRSALSALGFRETTLEDADVRGILLDYAAEIGD